MTRPLPTASRPRAFVPALAAAAAATLALLALSGCQAQPSQPPRGAITADRVVGDIMVRFTAPDVIVSEEAGKLLDTIEGPIRFVVKRPLSGGVWLVTAISASPDATMDQALATLRAAPRVGTAEPDRVLKPNHTMPVSRDMPAS
ncbi:hypothetical protein K2O51_17665 [Cupriavidus pinatubonensis]|uniref:hypothetical protein n=1 Tax=Cupriavidus pinatubonensis TaxID=248026 RepID=UPI0015E2ED55|nr:hypothetical protein [Cupriavidus pinatubonensis]QYY32599.1 hypothetical protein K2O51_17665 [Cupriavidus pinatubonensis]